MNEKMRAQVADLTARLTAMTDYATHLEWCRTCAEDGIPSCRAGSELKAAAFPDEVKHD